MLFLLQCSFFAWLLVCAPEVVAVLFGPQWTEAVVVVQAGAVGGMLWAPCGLANAVLTARGHAREQLQVNLVYGALLAALASGHPLGQEVRRAWRQWRQLHAGG